MQGKREEGGQGEAGQRFYEEEERKKDEGIRELNQSQSVEWIAERRGRPGEKIQCLLYMNSLRPWRFRKECCLRGLHLFIRTFSEKLRTRHGL